MLLYTVGTGIATVWVVTYNWDACVLILQSNFRIGEIHESIIY